MDVAFIGLGQMGSGMADNLVAAGYRVTVWNRDGIKAELLIDTQDQAVPNSSGTCMLV